MKKYDIVIVGGGNGGLSAAAYLSKAGKNVLVLEKHNLPGGCATSFRRGRFEFEATLHEMCQMGEEKGAVRKLLDDYGLDVDWVSMDEAFASINTDKETGFNVVMPVGVKAFVDEMEKAVPGSRKSMETVMELSRMICDGVDWLASYNNEPEGLAKVAMLFKWKDLMKLVPANCDYMLRKIGVPDKAREIYESYWDYIGTDSTRVSFAVYAFMTYTYLTQKPWICKNRSHEISMAFDEVIRKNGGDIWYNTTVKTIDVKNNQVTGVTLEDGRKIECDRVISNLMPTTVFGKMVDPKEVPERDKKLLNAREIAQCCFTVYLGLDISAKELGLNCYDTFIRTTGDNRKQFLSSNSFKTHSENCLTVLNNVIEDASEPGTCMIQFSKFYTADVMKDVKVEDYFKFKDKIGKEIIDLFEKQYNINVHDHIEEVVIATPATWARYVGTPYGVVYGYIPQTWDGMFPRVMSGHKEDYTIKGLRFVGGHGTQMDGYSQSYLSGREQARYMLQDMKEGK